MTSPQAAQAYLCEHLQEWAGKGYTGFNPDGKPLEELPTIYGFNNGGWEGWWTGALLAEDGAYLGSHICSHEGYMPHDLGVTNGSRPDRHETFQAHYPGGYRMDFVGTAEVQAGHAGLDAAYKKNQEKARAK